jgi:hypothetical protein
MIAASKMSRLALSFYQAGSLFTYAATRGTVYKHEASEKTYSQQATTEGLCRHACQVEWTNEIFASLDMYQWQERMLDQRGVV